MNPSVSNGQDQHNQHSSDQSKHVMTPEESTTEKSDEKHSEASPYERKHKTTKNTDEDVNIKKRILFPEAIDNCKEEDVMSHIEDIISQANDQPSFMEKLEILDSELKEEHFTTLLNKVENFQINQVSIGYSQGRIGHLLEACCKILKKFDTKKLDLECTDLEDDDIKKLQKFLDCQTLDSLNINSNHEIGENGFAKIRQISKKLNLRILSAADCDMTDDQLQKLLFSQNDSADEPNNIPKLKEMDLSWNDRLTPTGFGYLGKFIGGSTESFQKLKLSGSHLTPETLNAFCGQFKIGAPRHKTVSKTLLEELDISYNSTLNPEAFKVLCSLIKTCGVKRLSLAGCGLDEERLLVLKRCSKRLKVTLLDVADNSTIGEGITEIAKIVKESELEELNMSDCNFTRSDLKKFREALGQDSKLKRIHLGDQRRELEKGYISEVCELHSHVEEEVHLVFRRLRKSCRDMLQTIYKVKPKITFIDANDSD